MEKTDVRDFISNPNKLEKLLMDSNVNSVISYYQFKENVSVGQSSGSYSLSAFSIRRFSYLFQTYGSEIWHYLLNVIEEYLFDKLTDSEYFTPAANNKFLIYLKGTAEEAHSRLCLYFDEISEKMALDKCHMKVTFACGIYQLTAEDTDISAAIRKSTAAMHNASLRSSCVTEIAYYSTEIYDSVVRCNVIEQDLCNAVKNKELIVEIQPKFDLKTGKCISAEALVRWMHPTLGRIPPDDFIPFAEKTGFVIDIDMYVLETICKYMRRWMDSGVNPVTVAVNQSRLHISDPHYVDSVFKMMHEYDVWPSLIELETTESIAFNDYASVTEILHRLHDYGFVLSMDDFGSGYSSIYMLYELEYDELKLDKKLIDTISKSERSIAILKHMIAMAHDLNMTVVAEGVETEEQAEVLKSIGCDVAQGFLYSHPMPIDRFEASIFGKVISDEFIV